MQYNYGEDQLKDKMVGLLKLLSVTDNFIKNLEKSKCTINTSSRIKNTAIYENIKKKQNTWTNSVTIKVKINAVHTCDS